MGITMTAMIFLDFNIKPIIRLLIKIISGIAANYNFLSDFNEILYSSQLKDGEYNGDNYFSKCLCHTFGIINVVRGQL